MSQALIFDCDGVLADTERDGHLVAFNATFDAEGLPVRWSDEQYRELVKIGGGKERMRTLFDDAAVVAQADLPADEDARTQLLRRWHAAKTATYKELVRAGRLPARPGVARLMQEADAGGWLLAVASTSAEESVRAVLEAAVGQEFAARVRIFAGDVVAHKKPAPDIYLLALQELGVAATDAVVVEDSAVGARAAQQAGIRTLVTVSTYTAEEEFPDASLVVSDLGEPGQPARVIANRAQVDFNGIVTLATVQEIAAAPR